MNVTKSEMTQERRRAARSKVLRGGLITYNNGHCTLECVILELSENGAKLRPQDSAWIPERFELRLPDANRRYCDLVRKDRTNIAVRYVCC